MQESTGNIYDSESTETEDILRYLICLSDLPKEESIKQVASLFKKSIEEIEQIIKDDESSN